MMRVWVPQRHKLPASAARICASLGSGVSASNALAREALSRYLRGIDTPVIVRGGPASSPHPLIAAPLVGFMYVGSIVAPALDIKRPEPEAYVDRWTQPAA